MSTLPSQEFTYGRALRPQTPVTAVIMNQFGDESEKQLQHMYQAQKAMRSSIGRAPVSIRMTNAQVHADNAVRQKITVNEPKAQFKLKRFRDVEPRTSTKRGASAFMTASVPKTCPQSREPEAQEAQ